MEQQPERTVEFPGGLTVHVMAPAATVLVPLAELHALQRTAEELAFIVEALPAVPGNTLLVRSAQGLARALVKRIAGMTDCL